MTNVKLHEDSVTQVRWMKLDFSSLLSIYSMDSINHLGKTVLLTGLDSLLVAE